MLRPYKHVISDFHKIHSFVNHIFLDIVFRAPYIPDAEFSSSLVLSKYKNLIDEVSDNYILMPIKECFKICKKLPFKDLKTLKRAVHVNNKIRELCNSMHQPILYSEIDQIDVSLSTNIKAFCNKLYDKSIELAPFYVKYEKIEDYYKKLVGRSRTCRACGINKVLIKFHTHRSAFDHYLPKGLYPFTSINCNNLVPICDTCNSKYKTSEDTIFEIKRRNNRVISKVRKKAFYPFNKIEPFPSICINVIFNRAYSQNIEPADVDITIQCVGYEEQIETWDRLFGIKENYRAEICTDEMMAYYEEEYIARINKGESHQDYIELLENNKLSDANFLKIAFLEGIHNY